MSKSLLWTRLGSDGAVLLFLLLAGMLSAAECQLELVCSAGKAQETFFLDFSQVRPKSETFSLIDATGQEVPFSFDFSFGLPPPAKDEYRRKPDGFYSKANGPLVEKKYVRPGWVSFSTRPGQTRYRLTFQDGATEVSERGNSAARPWWIELLADPFFSQPIKPPLYYSTVAAGVSNIASGGVEFSERLTLFLNQGLFLADERIKGRRLLSYCCLQGQPGASGQYSFPYYSGIRQNAPVMHVYYSLPDERPYEIYCEGLVSATADSIWYDSNKRLGFSIDRPGRLLALRLQSPPYDDGLGLHYYGSRQVEPGDEICFRITGLNRDLLQPRTFQLADGRRISGGRVENWQRSPPFRGQIRDQAGKLIQESQRECFTLTALPPGKYILSAQLLHPQDEDVCLAQVTLALQYHLGPQW